MAALLLRSPASAQATEAKLTFQFDRPGLAVPSYTFVIYANGSGTYQGSTQTAVQGTSADPSLPGADSAVESEPPPPSAMQTKDTRMLSLTHATTAKLFEQARSAQFSQKSCASKAKNIANTGAKVLTLSSPEATSSCSFNYTENKSVVALTQTFQAMANTLEIGDRLEHLHRFDRLGLDQTMQRLVDAVESGQAVEVNLIAPALRSLEEDPLVLERVRLRAARLLASGSATP